MTDQAFADLFAEAETDPAYLAAGVAIEFTLGAHRAMAAQGVSRAELARRIGTSQANVSKLFGGSANFTIETMVKIASALGMTMVPTLGHRPVTAWPEELTDRRLNAHSFDDSAYGPAEDELPPINGTEAHAFTPLRLETYYVDETRTKALADFDADGACDLFDAVECLPLVDTHVDDPNRFRVRLDVSVTPAAGVMPPYEAFVRLLGFFSVTDPGALAEVKRQLIHGAAVSLLYSAARDHLFTVTAKGPNAPLMLPAVNVAVPDDRTSSPWRNDKTDDTGR